MAVGQVDEEQGRPSVSANPTLRLYIRMAVLMGNAMFALWRILRILMPGRSRERLLDAEGKWNSYVPVNCGSGLMADDSSNVGLMALWVSSARPHPR